MSDASHIRAAPKQNAGLAAGPPRTGGSRLWLFAGAAVLISLIVCLNVFCAAIKSYLEVHVDPLYREWGDWVLVGVAVLYALLLAIPFVPSVELGWVVMMFFGAKGTVVVYVATVLALALSFGIGRLVPSRWVAWLLRCLHLHRAEQFALRIAAVPSGKRLGVMMESAPGPSISGLLRFRYLVLAVLFNLPGNALIGGGGGIGILAGLSGIYSLAGYVLLVAIAILPVPLIFLVNHWMLLP
jgi:hypothetical protein